MSTIHQESCKYLLNWYQIITLGLENVTAQVLTKQSLSTLYRFMISQLKTWKTWVKLVEEILEVSIKCSISKQIPSWLSRYKLKLIMAQHSSKLCTRVNFMCFSSLVQRIRSTVDEKEQKQLLMDLEVVMRSNNCPFIVLFYGALFTEVLNWFL